MSPVYEFTQGTSPLLVSMPHSGVAVPSDIAARFSPAAKRLADTDWHIPTLYNFLPELNPSVIQANYSRYVIDLNRPSDGGALYPGKSETELCPTTTFTDDAIYLPEQELTDDEVVNRTKNYWAPYHEKIQQELARIKSQFGFALLWDAHSIASQVPRFFAGTLSDLNLGTADGNSCDPAIAADLVEVMQTNTHYTSVHNGRFKGGFITRHYGRPSENIHAAQMEIAQINYMSEDGSFTFDEAKAQSLRALLKSMLKQMLTYQG